MKRKVAKKIRPGETIHFRPGLLLGQVIAQYAERWRTSRGSAAKRLVVLAHNGLDPDFHDAAQELVTHLSETVGFEGACSCIRIRIFQVEQECRNAGRLLPDKSERLGIAKELSKPYRFINEIEIEAEEQRQKIHIHLTQ